jgi:predicted HicB family RNase H-like nuclease
MLYCWHAGIMSKDKSLPPPNICPDCGRDKNIVGAAHRCVPVPGWGDLRPTTSVPLDPPEATEELFRRARTVSPKEMVDRQARAKKRSSVEVVRAATDAVIDKFAAGKMKLTIRLDKDLQRRLKIKAAEQGATIEEWVTTAIEMRLGLK